jgi:hypothetical protein
LICVVVSTACVRPPHQALHALGRKITLEEATDMINAADLDGDGESSMRGRRGGRRRDWVPSSAKRQCQTALVARWRWRVFTRRSRRGRRERPPRSSTHAVSRAAVVRNEKREATPVRLLSSRRLRSGAEDEESPTNPTTPLFSSQFRHRAAPTPRLVRPPFVVRGVALR